MKRVSLLLPLLLCVAFQDAQAGFAVKRPERTLYPTLLTLDGGGLRQYMTNQILKRLEWIIQLYFVLNPELLPPEAGPFARQSDIEVSFADFFDGIAGVSAGSWVGMYYASKGGNGAVAELLKKPEILVKYGEIRPGSAAGVDVFFEEFSDMIYPPGAEYAAPRPSPDEWNPVPLVPGYNCPRYPVDGLEATLDFFFKNTTLADLHTSAIVSAYDLKHRTPILFSVAMTGDEPCVAANIVRSRSAPRHGQTPGHTAAMQQGFTEFSLTHESDVDARVGENFYIKDIVRASSAFPMVHGAKEVISTDGSASYLCIDGALTQNNPIFHALNFMLHIHPENYFQHIATLSLGTGVIVGETAQYANAGPVDWEESGALTSILMEAGIELIQSSVDTLLNEHFHVRPGQYLRINVFAEEGTPEAEAMVGFTDSTKLPLLKRLGHDAADEYDQALRNFVERYIMAT